MLPAIELNNQPHFRANEIGDVTTDRHLATESKSVQLLLAQMLPQVALCIGGGIA
jgi:hypothetical protein